ncbi:MULTISPECIES: hypothetical protein [unclassified Leeuwenhoekiella]|uniref:hypothetical protein n=1 Tax=unclassified Leeuwenhoekiella TaxID=2615029 RepID=UPI000C456857|nr:MULTISPECIES: hypothetical protein [unclassified Leeuwenhoekiella]MAW94178.1 hypothetical protein [Leeuwenhoekiella sp.]MAW96232.1 hypothetical protein [Leeuwenhoekiella sp.]MBA80226.1 hypothetical protein [Leeuwenhoekiella sp.]|tara:strand:+ start:16133 stop:16483 length:351 start_codon:yes stop_codon:yes gene_type:complete
MKNSLAVLLTLFFLSCDSETKTEQVSGEFIYYADAAVLQVDESVYGVVLDEKADELIRQASGYKKNPEDFVQVILKVIKTPKPPKEEGWDTLVKIKEIVAVSYPKESDMLRLQLTK